MLPIVGRASRVAQRGDETHHIELGTGQVDSGDTHGFYWQASLSLKSGTSNRYRAWRRGAAIGINVGRGIRLIHETGPVGLCRCGGAAVLGPFYPTALLPDGCLTLRGPWLSVTD